ncbi:MAG: amidohydrolase [Candidatus Lokiarchaeota archaeon]|nr:amidohydrolase [Candidatus Lokiarchaeota archaeon]
MLDLSDYPVIDTHCHVFREDISKTLTAENFAQDINFGSFYPDFLIPTSILEEYKKASNKEKVELDQKYRVAQTLQELQYHSKHVLFYRQMLHELAQLFDCADDLATIISIRNQKAVDFRNYLIELFTDARLEALIIDDGFSEIAVDKPFQTMEWSEFEQLVPIQVVRFSRIENLIKNALLVSSDFDEFLLNYDNEMNTAITKYNSRGFKSIVAYRTGLNIRNPDESDARKDFIKYRQDKSPDVERWGLKNLRDFLIWRTVEKCIELDLPFQFHTGIGDVDTIVDQCNPVCLFNFLRDKKIRHAKIILAHAGFPYISEATNLLNLLPNVYLELSVMFPFTSAGSTTNLMRALELAPLTKVMIGSDAFNTPELYWLGAKVAKKALGRVLSEFIQFGAISEDEAHKFAGLILSENTKRLYKL